MKKLFALLLTLLLVFVLPVSAMAADTDTADAAAETVTEAVTAEEGTEPVEDEGPKTSFGFYPETALVTLPIMGMGMLGIFLVTCVIILAVLVLSKFGGKADEE